MLENNALEVFVLLFILIYGIGLGFGNYATRIRSLVARKGYFQSNIGKCLDASLFLAIIYLWLFQPKFIDLVISKIIW